MLLIYSKGWGYSDIYCYTTVLNVSSMVLWKFRVMQILQIRLSLSWMFLRAIYVVFEPLELCLEEILGTYKIIWLPQDTSCLSFLMNWDPNHRYSTTHETHVTLSAAFFLTLLDSLDSHSSFAVGWSTTCTIHPATSWRYSPHSTTCSQYHMVVLPMNTAGQDLCTHGKRVVILSLDLSRLAPSFRRNLRSWRQFMLNIA